MFGNRNSPVRRPSASKIMHSIFCVLTSAALALAGIGVAAGAVWLSLNYKDSHPILLTPPDSATHQLVSMLDAVCQGDYDQASTYLLGNPDLGVEGAPEDPVGALLWEHYQESIRYELVGECYATADGLAQDITVSYMDLESVTPHLRDRSQAMMEQRVAEAEDTSQIYDENNEYREDFVMDILYDTVQDALAEDAKMATVSLTVNLKYQSGQWWILVDSKLLDAISGGILF